MEEETVPKSALWEHCSTPEALFELVNGVSSRRYLLVGVGCSRVVRSRFLVGVWKAMRTLEKLADQTTTPEELAVRNNDLRGFWENVQAHRLGPRGLRSGITQSQYDTTVATFQLMQDACNGWREISAKRSISNFIRMIRASVKGAIPDQMACIRDIFGNPFRPVTFAPEWRTLTVLGIAETIYADRTFGNLPILADALEDAGCDHADILSHCRGPGPHVRGCWVVDLVLGKS